jgi:site-specific DNA-methyltransferase (adenine-specific)
VYRQWNICLYRGELFPGQTILDPFVGGGTTAVVSLKRGCSFIGIDIDENCIKKTEERVKNELRLPENETQSMGI